MKKIGKNEKGFTMAELLIVVAIVAVLVAISIPVFTAKLEKSREAVDVANMRAAKAEGLASYLTEEIEVGKTYFYNAEDGVLEETAPTDKYGKGTKSDAGTTYKGYDAAANYTKSVVTVSVDEKGKATVGWSPSPTKD